MCAEACLMLQVALRKIAYPGSTRDVRWEQLVAREALNEFEALGPCAEKEAPVA